MPNPPFSILHPSRNLQTEPVAAALNRTSDLDISEGALDFYFKGGWE